MFTLVLGLICICCYEAIVLKISIEDFGFVYIMLSDPYKTYKGMILIVESLNGLSQTNLLFILQHLTRSPIQNNINLRICISARYLKRLKHLQENTYTQTICRAIRRCYVCIHPKQLSCMTHKFYVTQTTINITGYYTLQLLPYRILKSLSRIT